MDETTSSKKKKTIKSANAEQQNKFDLIAKLSSAGFTDGKQLCEMAPAEIIEHFPDITTGEMKIMLELQTAVGTGTVYNYICG